jgi:hypothetical protein
MLTEKHPVIEKILDTTAITGYKKLLALDELLRLERINKRTPLESPTDLPAFSDRAKDVEDLFLWENSRLGSKFWAEIQDKVFEAGKRSCGFFDDDSNDDSSIFNRDEFPF